ncbi:exosortase-associated EpsI family protein [Coraliomargarita parva]|uniref:exosortase-associated EpsI family protein n=1 Tax=Coraliomargarita parva TaxID=3014050 RepID=UPI0022B2C5EC|nr:exosortase-associated EpsI family protein [Coraliomargarita parva]
MKKVILISGLLILLSAFSLRAYFAFVPPPEASFHGVLSEAIPSELPGWDIKDMDMADSPESSERISRFLNFDDALFRVFQKDDTFVGLYVAYWTPGKASYRWAGAHTPDTCWVLNGWTREDRKYSVPFGSDDSDFQPAEFGVYSKDGNFQNVYFWHLVGGSSFGYKQEGMPNIFGALIDIKSHGLNLRQEQFFIRLSSNKSLEELKATPGFNEILKSLAPLGLAADPIVDSVE